MAAIAQAFKLDELPAGWQPVPERIPSSGSDSNLSTSQTVPRMARHIKDACALTADDAARIGARPGEPDPKLLELASQVSGRWGRGAPQLHCCWDIFWFAKHRVRFLIDEIAVAALYGETNAVDFLKSPSVLMREVKPSGDCDDFTMLIGTLLKLNGIPFEIVTVKTDPREPWRWTHVYPRAVLPDGRRIVLDAGNEVKGTYPGWEIPQRDILQKQVWDMEGRAIQDLAPPVEPAMHGIDPAPVSLAWPGVALAILAGVYFLGRSLK